MKNRLLLSGLVAVSAAAPVCAHSIDACGLDSRYDVSLNRDGLAFERTGSQPARVVMRKGHLLVDGHEIELSAADSARIAEYEATVRALVPQAKAIARDAVGIAFTAVGEVATAFASSGPGSPLYDNLRRLQREVVVAIDASFDSKPWNEKQIDEIVESTMKEVVPVIVGEIGAHAVRVALSGDTAAAESLERRAEHLEEEIERRIDTQTRQLAARASALCPMLVQLDAIEANLDVRFPDGSRLDLLSIDD